MNNLIAESIKNIVENSQGHMIDYEYVEEDGSIRIDKALPIGNFKDWLRVGLQAIAEKTREETLWEISTEVHKMTNKYGEGYMAAVVDVKSILAKLNTDKESK